MMNEATRNALGRLLSERGGTLYALYDAAADNSLLGDLQRDGVTHECLYSGTKAITLRNVAPYLIPCAQFQSNVAGFINQVWHRGVTMLVESGSWWEALKVQLKKNSYVRNSEGEVCYFRYYDARAFARFVRLASNDQLSDFFGSACRTIYFEDAGSGKIIALAGKRKKLISRIFDPDAMQFDARDIGAHQ
ncbi:DUF4123 domain-containing protein [Massilia antarctica]|uniref:DUF4123 domain-containing protein n=1 Tax=Massilia antarctica TaxID=2765360 RepID=UPI0006BB6228|nr:DUF4123 domain-containing protein [Massilia sp. H27-R4]MCY0916145.1 DUF4123 domain-containing protein [Massilia sp. H27-R4]CUI05989.1 hypothetical protein BN2497_6755 [Janthinobacterium sp. CG23_2]CUU29775.1 hypothetical protein BN3177_6755 [Janthinobacterium sp. CG23_2]